MICERCKLEVSESSSICTSCGTFAGYCNVRIAEKVEEVEALEVRYRQALMDAEGRGVLGKVEEFDADVRTISQAVVAMDPDTLCRLATNANELFSNYQLMVRAHARKAAILSNDQRRMAVDGRLWGQFGSEIRYAALSLDRKGLLSYGDCFAILRDLHIEHRTSVLEKNSYDFVESSESKDMPLGRRSNWKNRHKVAVAKCAERIDVATEKADFPRLLMESGITRQQDDFIEVHIFGPFDFKAIDAIGTSGNISEKRDQLTLEIIKKYAAAEGKIWL
jgi:hypothetical protein